MNNNTDNRSYANKKPFRNKAQKEMARKLAVKCEDGTWRSTVPVSYHKLGKKD